MSNQVNRQMHLNAFIMGTGQHLAAWRHPLSQRDGVFSISHYKQVAQIAEKGLFDALFFADNLGLQPAPPESRAQNANFFSLEPITLLSYLSAVTEHIGLISTVSASYLEPFHLARKFASLDHISNGRAGWNLVTSATDFEARNFALDNQRDHSLRYRRAAEYAKIVKGLWDSFEDDAFTFNKESAQFYQPDKLHELNYRGEHFTVKGPLHIRRPVQGYPVMVQAGSSEDGQELAAETAEVVFTAQQTLQDAVAFYQGLKSRLAKYGRREDELLILPGVYPVIGKTEQEAKAKYQQLQDLIPEASGLLLIHHFGLDVTKYGPDDPFPELPHSEGFQSRIKLLYELALRENLTIRQVFQRVAGGRGHWTIFGTPASIADQLEEWFTNFAADGFNVMPPLLPSGLSEFVEQVIPELQGRGLFRTAYEGRTLRENLGLKRPQNQYAGYTSNTF
ncbi:LLM class flavin-dependent oxidoreductase [Mucilaginibacter paludis]|uniref:FMN-dependent oxidoreductase, nitrilotriacetate monooxygenase family n=1 Tax=Mucilaginibacter paludis DSM 18603 TaxID=714943 RepID=H1Y5B1_9SPHI|nr:LLM class flavin-dependent oxidoreductase [Mucilaginibacter paludis]EHQ28922.1 FMN-dependent oxidoreductase, nitrilotriacetate monooxygenase family [Mucilaginibacter paludis DSM 18603]